MKTYVANVRDAFIKADPDGKAVYTANAAAYDAKLDGARRLDQEPKWRRFTALDTKLVTNHASAGYFADRYGFQIVGTVIPGFSTNETPTAQELAALTAAIRAKGGQGDLRGEGREPPARAADRGRGPHHGRQRDARPLAHRRSAGRRRPTST